MIHVEQFQKDIYHFINRVFKEKPSTDVYFLTFLVKNYINNIKLNDYIYQDIVDMIVKHIGIKFIKERTKINELKKNNLNVKDIIKFLKRQENTNVLIDPLILLFGTDDIIGIYRNIFYDLDVIIFEKLFFFKYLGLQIEQIKKYYETC